MKARLPDPGEISNPTSRHYLARAAEHHVRAEAARTPRVAALYRELAEIFETLAKEAVTPPT